MSPEQKALDDIDTARKAAAEEFHSYVGKDKACRAYLHGVATGLQMAWILWEHRKPLALVGSNSE